MKFMVKKVMASAVVVKTRDTVTNAVYDGGRI